jgi:hypothetical protein
MESRTQCYMFRMTDYAAIVIELDVVDWFSIFSQRKIDCFVDLFYEMVWNCFERHVPTRFSCSSLWNTRNLSCLTNENTKTPKRSKQDETIDD